MLWRPTHHKMKSVLPSVYLATFFLSVHYSIALYIDSSFLSRFFGDTDRNTVYMLGSLFTIFCLALTPRLLRKYGNYAITMFFTALEIVTLASLAFFSSPFLIAFVFIAHVVAINILSYNLDIFIEHGSKDETTGQTRGVFLTVMNTAVFLGPVFVGFILSDGQFWRIYTVAGLLMLPFLYIIGQKLSTFRDPVYKDESLKEMLSLAWKNKNIRFISIANFLLQFFYVWMVIYMPIYLATAMHFNWGEIGIIFSVMLLPFIFLEYPLGEIADHRFGEKEMLIIGFIIMAISTGAISFLTAETSVLVWATILFMTRVGAATVEIMTETYFFKQIEASDMSLISFFRHTRPLSFVIGAAGASAFLAVADMKYLFLTLGILMLSGIYFALKIVDTK